MRRLNYKKISSIKPYDINYTDWKESVVLLGDSTTHGQFIEEKDKLHNVLKTERPVNNLAYPAESNEHIFRKLVENVTTYGYPYMFVIGWSSPWRLSVIEADGKTVSSVGHWTQPWCVEIKAAKEFLDVGKLTLKHRTIDFIKAARLICKDRCKYFEWTVFAKHSELNTTWKSIPGGDEEGESLDVLQIPYEDRGADGLHPGPKTIKALAEIIGNV